MTHTQCYRLVFGRGGLAHIVGGIARPPAWVRQLRGKNLPIMYQVYE